MIDDVAHNIIKNFFTKNSLHNTSILKFYNSYPDIKEFVENKVLKNPLYQTIGYYVIMVVKNLNFKKCRCCGKEMNYESSFKNKRVFCNKICSSQYRKNKNKDKDKNKKEFSNKREFSNKIIFENFSEQLLFELYKNSNSAKITHLYYQSEQARNLANLKFSQNPNFRTPIGALKCICKNIKLSKCLYCGKELPLSIRNDKQQLYCNTICAHKGKTYISRQQKGKYNFYYNKRVLAAKKNNLTLLTSKEEYNGLNSNNRYRCNICNKEFIYSGKINESRDLRCPYCCIGSFLEKNINDFLLSQNINSKIRYKGLLKNLELDFVIPLNKLAIECNGLYWHSDAINNDNYYHLKKTLKTNENNYKLFHIFEDEIIYRKKAVYSIIKELTDNKIKISHNICSCKKIGINKAEKFLLKYSLLLDFRNKWYNGIFYKNRLICVITQDINGDIIDISKMTNIVIDNIESLLSKYFHNKKIYQDRRIPITYNFKVIEEKDISYYYVNGNKRYINKPKNAKNVYKIYDCGKLVYQI